MNCPHCQKELPVNHPAIWCPFCGRELVEGQTPADEFFKTNWPVFFAVLLAPAVLSLIGIAFNSGTLTVLATFGGSLLAGKICAGMLAGPRGYSTAVQWLIAVGLAALSIILCFGGCMAGAAINVKH